MRFLRFTLALAALTAVAYAGPITYIETGQITGRLGDRTLTNTDFSFTFVGDTANVTTVSGTLLNAALSNSIAIGGLTGAFTSAVDVGVNSPLIGFVNTALNQGITLSSLAVTGYGLITPISVSGTTNFASGTFSTSLGNLVISNAQNLTFQALVGTPEPGTAALSLTSLLALAGAAYRRKKRS